MSLLSLCIVSNTLFRFDPGDHASSYSGSWSRSLQLQSAKAMAPPAGKDYRLLTLPPAHANSGMLHVLCIVCCVCCVCLCWLRWLRVVVLVVLVVLVVFIMLVAISTNTVRGVHFSSCIRFLLFLQVHNT